MNGPAIVFARYRSRRVAATVQRVSPHGLLVTFRTRKGELLTQKLPVGKTARRGGYIEALSLDTREALALDRLSMTFHEAAESKGLTISISDAYDELLADAIDAHRLKPCRRVDARRKR